MNVCVQNFVGKKRNGGTLFISIMARKVCSGGRLMPSSMCWVRFVRKVEVEWFFLNPCWKGEREIRGSKRGEGFFL